MTKFKKTIAMLTLCALLTLLGAHALGETITVWVSRDGAKVYDIDGNALCALPIGTQLECTGVKGKICRVESGGKVGYMKKADLTSKAKAEPETVVIETPETAKAGSFTAYVSVDGAKVYNAKGKQIGMLSLNTELTVTAVKGQLCRVTAHGATAYMKKSCLSKEKVPEPSARTMEIHYEIPEGSAATPAHGEAKEADWWESDIQTVFARGVTAVITDVETGLAWKEERRGGTNHADCQPCTAADTAAMKKACGSWSWKRRAIFVTIDGVSYAASMNCMPHGGSSISGNNFDGHHCIHFTNSRTHESDRVDPGHQAAIAVALAAKL